MALVLRRREGESWLEAAQRHAEPHGLSDIVTAVFLRLVREGETERDAAFEACFEWDILTIESDALPC
jgi:hypothetical protein